MARTIIGKPDGAGLRIALVVSRFNESITSRLLSGARQTLSRHFVSEEDILEVQVPGVWELPLAVKALIDHRRCDAIVCLGCVIRGETSHHLYVAGEGIRGIASASLAAGIPVSLGVLTTENIEQAEARSGPDQDNKGAEAAQAAIEMVRLLRSLDGCS